MILSHQIRVRFSYAVQNIANNDFVFSNIIYIFAIEKHTRKALIMKPWILLGENGVSPFSGTKKKKTTAIDKKLIVHHSKSS